MRPKSGFGIIYFIKEWLELRLAGGEQIDMAAHDEHMQRFLAPKQFRTRFGSGRTRYLIEVETPDLRRLDYRVWGDWGPMYSFDLPLDAVFSVRYSEESGQSALYTVSPPTAAVESPMRALERERHPFLLSFFDTARGLQFRAFMDKDGEVDQVEVARVHAALDVAKLLFREHRRMRSTGERRTA